jgi:bacterioferritin (cytochrome b1)
MPELTKDRLVAILNERIADELDGVETYNGIWEMVHESKMPRPLKSDVLYTIGQIIAEEELHITRLQETLEDIIKIS